MSSKSPFTFEHQMSGDTCQISAKMTLVEPQTFDVSPIISMNFSKAGRGYQGNICNGHIIGTCPDTSGQCTHAFD